MSLTVKELAIKEACERSLLFFTRYMFKEITGRKFQVSEHHKTIAHQLERSARGDLIRLIINIPPRYGKTELAVKMYPAWCYAHRGDAKFIHLSYADPLALDNSDSVKEIVKHPAFQKFWPLIVKHNKDSKKAWGVEGGGTFYAAAAGGAVTGFGAGVMDVEGEDPAAHQYAGAIIIDDPVKPDDARSEKKRLTINERYNATIASRVNSPNHTPVIVIMQRLHEDDMAGFLLNGGSQEEWEHICLPAIKEDGTPLWPEKHTIEQLRAMERANKYVFASQYMQQPVPYGDGLFKVGKIEILDVLPSGINNTVRYWDKAGSSDTGCYTAGAHLGELPDGRTIVLDMVRGQWSALEREQIIKSTAQTDGFNTATWIEQEGGSGGKESAESTIRNLSGFNINAEHPTGSKEDRAVPFACQVEAGNVVLLKGEWNKAFLDELRFFPAGKYKDQVDASSAAFNKLHAGSYDIFALT